MDHIVADWERSDEQVLSTYRRFVRMTVVSSIFLVILLVLMALFLL